jgi:hypothetical protein
MNDIPNVAITDWACFWELCNGQRVYVSNEMGEKIIKMMPSLMAAWIAWKAWRAITK